MFNSPKYVNGALLNGELTSTHPNGKIRELRTYKDGLLDGPCVWFRENGSKEQETIFEKGVPVGTLKMWDEQGLPKQVPEDMKYCQRFCINV